MSYYEDVYKKRLNRYGLDYQSRVQGQRERMFEDYLLKTLYRVDFLYEGESHPGSLERYKQDYSETQAYLLTRTSLKMANGTILEINSETGHNYWMVWWLEHIEATGYNKYVLLKMTNEFTLSNFEMPQWAYLKGPGTSTIQDSVKSATGKSIYTENNNLYMLITPTNELAKKDSYFEILSGTIKSGYIIKDIDVTSTKGVSYISIDPVPLREATAEVDTPAPSKDSAEYYWLEGGNK